MKWVLGLGMWFVLSMIATAEVIDFQMAGNDLQMMGTNNTSIDGQLFDYNVRVKLNTDNHTGTALLTVSDPPFTIPPQPFSITEDFMQQAGELRWPTSDNRFNITLFGDTADLNNLSSETFESVVTSASVSWWHPDFDVNFTNRLTSNTTDFAIVPEPASGVLLLGALGMVVHVARRRRLQERVRARTLP